MLSSPQSPPPFPPNHPTFHAITNCSLTRKPRTPQKHRPKPPPIYTDTKIVMRPSSPPPMAPLFLLLLAAAAGGAAADCEGRRIHIRPLPSRFNTDLLSQCDAYPILDNFCAYLANSGLGPLAGNRSRSWYRTDPLLLEPLFHRRLLEYPCLTDDPLAADALFLPYYSALAALPYLYSPLLWNHSALHGLDLHRHLLASRPSLLRRRHAHDHFLVMSRPAWDFSQDPLADPPIWGTSFLSRAEFANVTALVPEARPRPWQDRAVPPPTSFHPATAASLDRHLARARASARPTLMLFAGGGGGGGPNIRGSIRAECANRSDVCAVVDCSDGACARDAARYMRPMLGARFCLQPPGDTPTRRSTFDAILAGCVPVFFEDLAARAQYRWHLPPRRFREFSVMIPKEEVVFGGVRIADVLGGIPEEEVRRMRERVLELAPGVVYRRHGSDGELRRRKDAFDLAIEGVLRRIKRRVRLLDDEEALLLSDDNEEDDYAGDGAMDGRDSQ